MAEKTTVQSLDRAFDILEQLCQTGRGMSIKDLTAATGLNKSTVHRMLHAMIGRGYVVQDELSGRYQMTTKLYALGGQVVDNLDLVEAARHPMNVLSQEVGETVHLVVPEGTDIVYVYKMEAGQDSVRMVSRIGMHRPMYCTASGKAILACFDSREVERIWAESRIVPYTPHTITDWLQFRAELEEIRRRGTAFDQEENEVGIRCIAAAIHDYSGQVCGALSVSVPQQHERYQRMAELQDPLLRARDRISGKMGFVPGR